jgi:uncharacterized protein YggE
VTNVLLTLENRIPVQNEVRIEALHAARDKAAAMAGALNSRIAEPLLIEEEQSTPFQPRMVNYMAMDKAESDGGSSISLGLIPVEMQVHVVFRLMTE